MGHGVDKVTAIWVQKWLETIPTGVSKVWQDILNTILQVSSRSWTHLFTEFSLLTWLFLRACLLNLQMTESQERLQVCGRIELVYNLSQPPKMGWGNHDALLRKEDHIEGTAKSSAENDLGVQGMANQIGVTNVVWPQKFKQAWRRPRARQREGTHQMGTGVRFNWAARCLEVLWKHTVLTQTRVLGRKKGCIWLCAREMAHAKTNV